MKYVISAPSKPLRDTVRLPASKSISNRMLIIRALSGGQAVLENLSESDDTLVLDKALKDNDMKIDVGHAGTAMRFLTAYLCTQQGSRILDGSRRMQQRPVGPLVDALKQLGASIEYLGKAGFPPLQISGGAISGGSIAVEAGISSQFISALMMIAPRLDSGLRMELCGEVVSASYIRMTRSLMESCRVAVSFDGRVIEIPKAAYRVPDYRIESDWSAASYWYQMAALTPGSEIRLPALDSKSLQGDSVLVDIFNDLGVRSEFDEKGLRIYAKGDGLPAHFSYDFTLCPDLVQTCVVTLCALGLPFRIRGTQTLRVKETDRIAALEAELGKLGFPLTSSKRGDWMSWDGSRHRGENDPLIRTYHDHRMAMAFAPLSLLFQQIRIDDPAVVSKSYPGYWDDLAKVGFQIN